LESGPDGTEAYETVGSPEVVENVPNGLGRALRAVLTVSEVIAPHVALFEDATVLFTGLGPFLSTDLVKLLPPEATAYQEELREGHNTDLMVLGQYGYDVELIHLALSQSDPQPRVLPQEGFLDEVLFGWDWWKGGNLAYLELVAEYHTGLQYMKSLEWFQWPTTEAEEVVRPSANQPDYDPETELHAMGYVVGKNGLSAPARWRILEGAVDTLGLKAVAYIIASNCRRFKRQKGGREKYAEALADWEHDLAKLKDRFYRGYTFRWPGTEP
jgi:hypothetical protein